MFPRWRRCPHRKSKQFILQFPAAFAVDLLGSKKTSDQLFHSRGLARESCYFYFFLVFSRSCRCFFFFEKKNQEQWTSPNRPDRQEHSMIKSNSLFVWIWHQSSWFVGRGLVDPKKTEVFHKVGCAGPCLKIWVAQKLLDTSLLELLKTEVEKGFMWTVTGHVFGSRTILRAILKEMWSWSQTLWVAVAKPATPAQKAKTVVAIGTAVLATPCSSADCGVGCAGSRAVLRCTSAGRRVHRCSRIVRGVSTLVEYSALAPAVS